MKHAAGQIFSKRFAPTRRAAGLGFAALIAFCGVQQYRSSSSVLTPPLRFAGYHGSHRGPEEFGPEGTASASPALWNPPELGQGLYLATHKGAALLYGATAAQATGSDKVHLYRVMYKTGVWREPAFLPNSLQHARYPAAFDAPPYDVVVSLGDYVVEAQKDYELPTQYKVNRHRTKDVVFVLEEKMDADAAFDRAEALAAEEGDQGQFRRLHARRTADAEGSAASASNAVTGGSLLPRIPVAPDGHCFFSSVAWHTKLTPEQRAAYPAARRGPWTRQPFGSLPSEQVMVAAVRHELASWMEQQCFVGGQPSNRLTPVGEKFFNTWNLLTDSGTDTHHFGSSFSKTIQGLREGSTWGDVQLLWRACTAIYQRPLIVFHHTPEKPFVFVDPDMRKAASLEEEGVTRKESGTPLPILLSFQPGSMHYEAVAWHGAFQSAGI